jgi:2,4-diketo-3-deoxy-L-fuconate hydrolase
MIGRAFSCLMVLVNIYPAFCMMSNPDVYKAQWQLAILADTIAEADIRKNFKNVKEPEDALTLSRYLKDGRVHTIAVLEDDGTRVTGIDLSEQLSRYDRNSFDVIKGLEYNTVVRHIRSSSDKVSIKYDELLPCVEGKEHIAIGINFAEHGKETGQVKPFMFPKFVQTDPAIHKIDYQKGWLLDHEVELGIVFPSAVCSSADLEHMMIGFMVVNDFTDRAELMRKMDSKNVTGGKGFPDAKSKAGFLPTGPYMVIPKDWREFVTELQLQLSVNGKIRQKGSAVDMVWNIDEIIRRTLLETGKYDSYFQDKKVKLFKGDCIPPNSIIITGTPSGVVFNAPTGSFIFSRVLKYLFTGKFFNTKMHPYVVEQYLKKDLKNPGYLKPGDRIVSSINYLGTIATCIGK